MKCGEYELIVAPEGYPGTLYRDRYAYEHTVVWWLKTGEVPNENELIHHINGDKRDNRFENLELKSRSKHSSEHMLEKGKMMVRLVCPSCNKEFVRERRQTHLVKPNKVTFCSRSCVGATNDYSERDQVVEIFRDYSGVAQMVEAGDC